jgi:hypothetical protein
MDGNMDGLTVGTPPDCTAPAGAWQFPANYQAAALCEVQPTYYTIAATGSFDPTRSGNSLALAINDNVNNMHLTNILPAPIVPAAGQVVRSTWEVFVEQTGGGGSVYIGADMGGGGFSNATDRGPQLLWTTTGSIVYTANGVQMPLVATYPRGVWQSVQVDMHLDTQTFDFSWAPTGQPLQLIGSNLGFRIPPPAALTMIDRWSIAHFGPTPGDEVSNAFYDNVTLALVGGSTCYANCDQSTGAPILNVNDFVCFQNRFAAGDSYANCDQSTMPPVLNMDDFMCFQSRFAAGCSAP